MPNDLGIASEYDISDNKSKTARFEELSTVPAAD